MKFRAFEKTDWYGFAGAECFPDGTDPIISEVASANGEKSLTVIVDGGGVSLYLDECEKDTDWWILSTDLFRSQTEALGWAESAEWSAKSVASLVRRATHYGQG